MNECCGIGFLDFKQIFPKCANAAALGCECRSIEGSDFQKNFLGDFECRGIGLWMPQHWAYWLPTFFSSIISMLRHWMMNAAALVLLPKFRFSLLVWMSRHWWLNAAALSSRPKWMPGHSCLNVAALSPVSAYLCLSTFQPYFFSYFGPNNLWITRWRRLMKK